MPVRRAASTEVDAVPDGSNQLEIAFVNNMSDGGQTGSERQFTNLLQRASAPGSFVLRRYRGGRVSPSGGLVGEAEQVPLSTLFDRPPDAIVVSGCEPTANRLADEAFWPELHCLLDWIADRRVPAFLSCLAAHAALLAYDGIERRRLGHKCTGVFEQRVEQEHRLGRDLQTPVAMPHSRLNDVSLDEVVRAGFAPVVHSREVGWAVVSKEVDGALLVLAQGHPEYEGATLLREYRRDIGRLLNGVRADVPDLPVGCVDPSDSAELQRLHERLVSGERSTDLLGSFPFEAAAARAPCPWAATSAGLFSNWLESVAQSTDCRTSKRGGR